AALAEGSEGDERAGRGAGGAPAAEDFTLDDLLLGCARGLQLRILLIFDQFEEYFLYHTPGTSAEGFDAEFARAVNQHDDGVNFMISMREEELSKLDRFRVRIPNLLTNLLRLENLDRESAAEAITRPLEVYNAEHPEAQKSIQPELVEAILRQVGPENLGDRAEQPAADRRSGPGGARIETPFLQVVLTRLWEEERRLGSDTLRLDTLNELGGAKNIARTHLDEVMSKLDEGERDAAASVLRFLVTPAGAKIAQQPSALASWAELDPAAVRSVLTHLSSRQEMCILRKVTVPGQEERYELFHDVLGPAILNWQSRYTQARRLARQRAEAEEKIRKEQRRANRLAVGMAALVLLLVGMGALTAYALNQKAEADKQKAEADKQKTEADKQKGNAEEQERIAKNALVEVAHERDRANEQKTEAEKQKKIAEGQKEEAVRAQAREAEARRVADDLKREADRQARLANERAAEAELASKKVQIEALKGVALSDLMEGRIKEAVENFTKLDERYGELKDPAGRAYANLKIADIFKGRAFVDFIMAEMMDASDQIEDPGEDPEAAMARQLQQYSQMVSLLMQGKSEKDMFEVWAEEAARASEFYDRALGFNRAVGGPDRPRREGEILSKLGDVQLGLTALKLEGDVPDKGAGKLSEEEVWNEVVQRLEIYEKARAAYREAQMPLEEAHLFRKTAAILSARNKDAAKRAAAAAAEPGEGAEENYDEEAERQVIDYYNKAADAYVRAQQPLAAALMHIAAGGIYQARKDSRPAQSKAVEQYELARQTYRAEKEDVREAAVTKTLAGLYEELNDTGRALDYYKQAHAAYLRAKSSEAESGSRETEEREIVRKIAETAAKTGAGEAQLRKYVEQDLLAAGDEARARASAQFGDFYRGQAKPAEALWYYGRERESWRKARRPRDEADALFKMGKLQNEAGKTADALSSFGEARKVYAALEGAPPDKDDNAYRTDFTQSLLEMAAIYVKHDLREAVETYEEALRRDMAPPARSGGVTRVIREAGRILLGTGSPEAEREFVGFFQKALDRLGAEKNIATEAAALAEIGDVYRTKGESQEAGAKKPEYLREAVKHYELARSAHLRAGEIPRVTDVLRKSGDVKIKAGESEQAVAAYYEAVAASAGDTKDLAGQGSAFEALGNFYRQKDSQKALDFFQKARRAYGEGRLTQAEVNVLRSMASVHYGRGEKEQSNKLYKEADALSQKTR
ncbi:MAG: hypothetical protein M3416_15710, partial [Acidobacteriota bacterium]|nr:hypothetical protein [Acidobacteriota bacterium]